MKFLHTADWHIGNLFHDFDRTYEQQQFFQFLLSTLNQEKTDVLLISGDIYDVANPSAAAMRLFNSFLHDAGAEIPNLQIIITAGNHDSPSRLEVVKPLLGDNIQIIGLVERKNDGSIDYEKLIIPLKHKGVLLGYCLAVPFLRLGDYPTVAECSNPYAEGVDKFYQQIYQAAAAKRTGNEFIIALGHLHAQRAEISEQDLNERAIMGGIETISEDSFPDDIAYVALGHIHKAQRVSGKEHIRYSGSPLPMSFSEINYKHQVIAFEIEQGKATNIRSIEVPACIRLLQVPVTHSPVETVLQELSAIPVDVVDIDLAPYLQVRVLLTGPEPGLRHRIEEALKGKCIRLAKIDVRYPDSKNLDSTSVFESQQQLHDLKPFDLFSLLYESKYKSEVPESMSVLFRKAVEEVNQQDH